MVASTPFALGAFGVLFMTSGINSVPGLPEAFKLCRRSLIATGVFSFAINALMLTPMFYMINVFDKAVGNGSIPTLIALATIALFLYALLALLEWIRSLVLIHVAARLDILLSPRVYELCFGGESFSINAASVGGRPLQDLNALRQFVASPTCSVIFDLPWVPLFVALMFFFHPLLAVVGLTCMGIMAVIAFANQRYTTRGLKEANEKHSRISVATQRNLRNSEAASAMGMITSLMRRWRDAQNEMLDVQSSTSAISSGYSALIKTLTTVMQSVGITTGAVLAIQQEISPGVMIGAALLLGKSLQPIQQSVNGWKSFVEAREQYSRINDLLTTFPPAEEKMSLPPISGRLTARNAYIVSPGGKDPILADINLELPAGTITMVLGGSAAGKSSLLKALIGLWPTMRGHVSIDGAEAQNFSRDELGPQIGYLPQNIELFDGSVAENIARFGQVDPEKVVSAAEDAGVHNMILTLPKGYDTGVNDPKSPLTQGQKQRIALARALYDQPKLIVLDEPNSNLDETGELALANAISKMKSLGSSIVLVTHRQGALPLVDYLIIMENGRIRQQGARDAVIANLQASRQRAQNQQSVDQQPAEETQSA